MPVSPDYFSLYGIRILAGRTFAANRADDVYSREEPDQPSPNEGHNIMINATFARTLGFTPQAAVDQTILLGKTHLKIVGVAADALTQGAMSPVLSTVYTYSPVTQRVSILMENGRTEEAMAHIAKVSHDFVPNVALTRSFLDDRYERLYQAQDKQGQAFAAFVAVAIVIACLGLFGLAAFTADRRTREIGIRKVFGARDRDVLILLLWQFSVPVVIANAIAWPLAWYYLHGWLQGFAYRIALSPLYFVAIGLVALLIAWATIFAHAWRVARANPVHALRYE
jgi:putative ABC transport system permease protein